MGKKRKKGKKARKKALKKMQRASPVEHMDRAARHMNSGKPRNAIKALKLAIQNGGEKAVINPLLFRAYLFRESQLRAKGMKVEADASHRQGMALAPPPDKMTEEDCFALLLVTPLAKAAGIYAGHLARVGPSRKIEQTLAARLVAARDRWAILDALDESVDLRRDAAPVRESLDLMEEGDWEAALARLKSVFRSSPFAPVRMFCHAMVSFYNGDDRGMRRALSMIPGDFPFRRAADMLNRSPVSIACLWDGPVRMEEKMASYLKVVKKSGFRRVPRSLMEMGKGLLPDDSNQAIFHILEKSWPMTWKHPSRRQNYFNLIRGLLPENLAELLLAKIAFLEFNRPFKDAGRYISFLEREFPDAGERGIAHALILLNTIERILKGDESPVPENSDVIQYKRELGIIRVDSELSLIQMTMKAIRLDPENKAAYERLAGLPRRTRPAKKEVERGLTKMLEAFPDDPRPCMDLATLFYEKNAFRKAENILAEARNRAPHDARVLDRSVLALLISADINLKRKKLKLAARDIEKAKNMASGAILPLAFEKQIVFQIEEFGQLSLFGKKTTARVGEIASVVETAIGPLGLFEKLRTLGMLILDMEGRDGNNRANSIKALNKVFNRHKKDIKQLTSAEVRQLLQPIHVDAVKVISSRDMAGVYLKRYGTILRLVDDGDILPVYDMLMEFKHRKPALKDVVRRKKKADPGNRTLFEFYEVAIRHILGELDRDVEAFEDVVEEAEDSQTETLRAAGRRLARHASGPLKKALENFEFDLLRPPRFSLPRFLDPFDQGGPMPGGLPSLFDLFDFLDDDDDDDEDFDYDDF